MITTTNLMTAHSILTTYSEGTLPQPSYIAIGEGSITFVVATMGDINRWAQSADATVRTWDADGVQYTQTYFKHGDLYVYVTQSQKAEAGVSDEG